MPRLRKSSLPSVPTKETDDSRAELAARVAVLETVNRLDKSDEQLVALAVRVAVLEERLERLSTTIAASLNLRLD